MRSARLKLGRARLNLRMSEAICAAANPGEPPSVVVSFPQRRESLLHPLLAPVPENSKVIPFEFSDDVRTRETW